MTQLQGEIPATIGSLVELETFFAPLIADLDEETQSVVRLVVQELGTNIVLHAYAGQTGTIEVDFRRDGSQLRLAFRDYAAKKLDPHYTVALPDPESLPQGGWGLYIMHQSMDKVDYTPLPDGNRWVLYKTV